MSETRDVTLRIKINASPLIRGMSDMGNVMENMTADLAGKPRPPRKPYPKAHSGMTARQYRATRRRYAREQRAYAKTLRGWVPNRSGALRAFALLAQSANRIHAERKEDA